MQYTFSILVVALNEAAHISRLKQSIDRLRIPDILMLETILVDGGSHDETASLARSLGFSKVIVLPGASIPTCRNRSVREASGDWLAFVDADCELNDDWMMQALPLLESYRLLVLGWPVLPPDPPTWVQAAWHFHWMNKVPSLSTHTTKQPVVEKESFRLITTRNMILTRSVFNLLNGFDEKLPTGEDTDFVFRAYHRPEVTVLGLPTLKVVHHGEPRTLNDFFRQQLWHANRSSYSSILKTRGRAGRHAVFFSFAFSICLVLALAAIPAAIRIPAVACFLLLPLIILLILPALITAFRGRKPSFVPLLVILYALYGFARMLDLAGYHRSKSNWKR